MIIHELLICAALQAGFAQAPALAVEALPDEVSGDRFLSGQQIRIAFRFYGGQGTALDLRARAFQLSHSLAAPVGPSIEVAKAVRLGDEAWRDFSLTLDCPTVKRITTWELHHESRIVGGDSWRSVGTTRIELYPPHLLRPLQELAGTQRWSVGDPSGRLKAFLTAHGVAFLDLDSPSATRSQPGAETALVLWVRVPFDPERPAPRRRMPEPTKAARILVFDELSPVLPTTTLRLEPHRTSVTVDINLLSSLMDDPRAQMRFVEAIRMTQSDLGDGLDE